jgi:hypothetical protein
MENNDRFNYNQNFNENNKNFSNNFNDRNFNNYGNHYNVNQYDLFNEYKKLEYIPELKLARWTMLFSSILQVILALFFVYFIIKILLISKEFGFNFEYTLFEVGYMQKLVLVILLYIPTILLFISARLSIINYNIKQINKIR